MADLHCDCGYPSQQNPAIPDEISACFGAVEITDAKTQEKEVKPSTEEQVVEPDAAYTALSKVKVGAVDATVDPDIQPSNIKEGVVILGVEGTLKEGGTGSGGTKRYNTRAALPAIGDIDYIYIVKDENATYRWDEDELRYVAIGRDYNEIELIDCGSEVLVNGK